MDSHTSDAPPQPGHDLTGRTLGDYAVLRKLGQGGMGQVYLAEQRSLKRHVALKILKADLAANPTALQRFKAEAEAVARVTHANIVQVYAIGEADGPHYMALEYVEGRNLRDYLLLKGPPELLTALSLMRQLAAALQRAAEAGLIHRDIKPENILLTRNGEAKVADFGLSRCLAGDQPPLNLTQSGVAMGTPLYMSPEQVEGKPVDPRTDIYSLGVTCYHLLTGSPPYQGSNPFEVALQHVKGEPAPLSSVRPDLPDELCAIVHKMMARLPEQRFQTARDLHRELSRLREGLNGQTAATPLSLSLSDIGSGPHKRAVPTMIAPPPAEPRRSPTPWLAALVGLALLGGAALGWWQRSAEVRNEAATTEVRVMELPHSPQKREQWLREGVEGYLNPADGFRNPEGLSLTMLLGLLYLDQHRLDEARQLYGRLAVVDSHQRTQLLGQLGLAIVAALESRVEDSLKQFRAAMPDRLKKPDRARDFDHVLRMNDQFNWYLSEAISYNQANGGPDQRTFLQMIRRARIGQPIKPGAPRKID